MLRVTVRLFICPNTSCAKTPLRIDTGHFSWFRNWNIEVAGPLSLSRLKGTATRTFYYTKPGCWLDPRRGVSRAIYCLPASFWNTV